MTDCPSQDIVSTSFGAVMGVVGDDGDGGEEQQEGGEGGEGEEGGESLEEVVARWEAILGPKYKIIVSTIALEPSCRKQYCGYHCQDCPTFLPTVAFAPKF